MGVEDRSAITSSGAIRGWGCTPTGDAPPGAARDSRAATTCLPATLFRGWRRTCLYAIILFLMVLVFLNIALTLWIISTLRLNANGIGPIKIVKNGIQLDGQAWVVDKLVASAITSPPAQPVSIHSHRNFTVLVSEPASARNDTSQRVELAKLLIKRDSVVCSGRKFEVRDSHGKSVFEASRDEVRMSAATLAVDGVGGVTVRGAVQTPSVRAPPGSDLQLESLTRKLSLRAPQSIHFESRAGNIDVISHGDIKFDSVVGSIKIDAPNIVLSYLKEASVTDKPQINIRTTKVYQLCACATGKLFLAAADGACAATDDELCR